MSFLPAALSGWRAERPTKRAVIMRDGSAVLQEYVKFELLESWHADLASASQALADGTIKFSPSVRRTRNARRASQ